MADASLILKNNLNNSNNLADALLHKLKTINTIITMASAQQLTVLDARENLCKLKAIDASING